MAQLGPCKRFCLSTSSRTLSLRGRGTPACHPISTGPSVVAANSRAQRVPRKRVRSLALSGGFRDERNPSAPGAKRTCLLGKISSNLRPLTLERSLARKGRVPSFLSHPAHGPSPHFVAAGQVDRFRGKPDIKRHVGSAGPVAFDRLQTEQVRL